MAPSGVPPAQSHPQKPEAGGGANRRTLAAAIGVPPAVMLLAVAVIWSMERSWDAAARRDAQQTMQKAIDEAQSEAEKAEKAEVDEAVRTTGLSNETWKRLSHEEYLRMMRGLTPEQRDATMKIRGNR